MNLKRKGLVILVTWCLGVLFLASSAWAAVLNVRAVPWQGDTTKFHTALSDPGAGADPYSAWNIASDNALRVVFTGGPYFSWIRAKISAGGSDTTYCVFDRDGAGCSDEYLCTGDYSTTAFDRTVTIPAGPKPDSISLEVIDTCSTGSYEVFLNGVSLGNITGNADNNCTCSPGVYSAVPGAASGDNKYITLLKGVITTTNADPVWYKWVFGDGTETSVTQLSGATKYNVEADHQYSGAVGTPITAMLMVDGVDSSMANAVSDMYLVKIEEDNLDFRVNRVIDNGLWYLYKNQLAGAQSNNGLPVAAWSSYSSFHPSATGAALQAFQINNHKATGDFSQDPYAEVVAAGLNWLLTGSFSNQLVLGPITLTAGQTPGGANADGNGNGIGVQVVYSGYPPYQGGIVMDAIISSGTPDADSGRDFNGDGTNDTYQQVIQDMVDAYAWGQGQYNNYSAWSYNWNPSGTDNSTNQWAAIGLIPAQNDFGCTIPQFVKDQLNNSLTYTYSSANQWFGYTSSTPLSGVPGVTRPSGMVQMILAVPGYKTDGRWTGPETYYAEHFDEEFSVAHRTYYGWLSFVKAMILSGTESMSNGFSWYRGSATIDGLAQRLVDEHEADGSWPQGGQWTHPGEYGDTFVTSWAIQMLKPALFQAAPIACFTAAPNPTYADRNITFDPSCSDHSDSVKNIDNLVLFEWDWDNDGDYDTNSTGPDVQIHPFSCASLPCSYPVVLRVTDDEGLMATFSLTVQITNPPHPPEADAGGPYLVSLCATDTLTLNGSNSFDPDEGTHEAGCATCLDDTITAWDWDFVPPINGFDNASGQVVILDSTAIDAAFNAGMGQTIGLRVTDNTALAYPQSQSANLTDANFTTVDVYQGCACDLTAEIACNSVVLNWSANGTYELLRSKTSPNSGFEKIADVSGTTYTDETVISDTTYYYRLKGVGCMSDAEAIKYVYNPSLCELPVCMDDLTAIAKTRKVQLSWACPADAESYNVYRSKSPGVGLTPANKIAAGHVSSYCAYTDTSVTNGTTYFYRITKVVGGEEVCVSIEVNATPSARTR